jgi:hypothetical protein
VRGPLNVNLLNDTIPSDANTACSDWQETRGIYLS